MSTPDKRPKKELMCVKCGKKTGDISVDGGFVTVTLRELEKGREPQPVCSDCLDSYSVGSPTER
jgi:hypothetical protein